MSGGAGAGLPAGAAGGEWATNTGRRDKLAAHGQPPGCAEPLHLQKRHLDPRGTADQGA